MEAASDRRQTPRIDTAIRVEALDGGPTLYAQDVSLGGMLLTTVSPRWPGTMMRVRFQLPQQKRAICATVRVVDLVDVPHGIGLAVQFLRLASEAQIAIHEYVDSRPLESCQDFSVASRVGTWLRRIVEDCRQLQALSRT